MTQELQILVRSLIEQKPLDNQVICCIEEMSEAIKVLTKYLRHSSKFSKEKLTEEVAHALLMLKTIQISFDIPEADIEQQQLDALSRALFPKKSRDSH